MFEHSAPMGIRWIWTDSSFIPELTPLGYTQPAPTGLFPCFLIPSSRVIPILQL